MNNQIVVSFKNLIAYASIGLLLCVGQVTNLQASGMDAHSPAPQADVLIPLLLTQPKSPISRKCSRYSSYDESPIASWLFPAESLSTYCPSLMDSEVHFVEDFVAEQASEISPLALEKAAHTVATAQATETLRKRQRPECGTSKKAREHKPLRMLTQQAAGL